MPFVALLIILAALLGFAGHKIWHSLRKTRILKRPLSAKQRAQLADMVPICVKIPPNLRPRFEGKVNLFLDQVTFYGYEGVEVSDEMRLSIAAQASLIVMGSRAWYDTLRTVLLYPSAFRSMQKRHDGHFVTEGRQSRLGESWTHGPVILSWAHSHSGAADATDGHNVVLHEFAHQLDGLSGHVNGVPVLARGQRYHQWEGAFLPAFEAHERDVARGKKTLIDAYGATNHEEFFAVAIEVFFERPAALKREEPRIYAQLSTLLGLDPAAW